MASRRTICRGERFVIPHLAAIRARVPESFAHVLRRRGKHKTKAPTWRCGSNPEKPGGKRQTAEVRREEQGLGGLRKTKADGSPCGELAGRGRSVQRAAWNPEERDCRALSRTGAERGSSGPRARFGAGVFVGASEELVQESGDAGSTG